MEIKIPELPYNPGYLEPYISKETIEVHYGKHHKNYVKTLNDLIQDTSYKNLDIEEIIMESFTERHLEEKDQKIFANAAQTWNHSFYWNCLTTKKANKPSPEFVKIIEKNFNSFDEFNALFKKQATELFGSGWLWLVKDEGDKLSLYPMQNAGNPLVAGKIPLLTCDVWEHAYYLDQKNERTKYLDNFNHIINWEFVEKNFGIGSQKLREKGFRYRNQSASVH